MIDAYCLDHQREYRTCIAKTWPFAPPCENVDFRPHNDAEKP